MPTNDVVSPRPVAWPLTVGGSASVRNPRGGNPHGECPTDRDSEAGVPRILVVDDDPDLRELIGLKFRNAGLEVVYACDGVDALNRIREHGADLVVLDVMMPGKSGIDVCRELRDDAATADLPIVMVTARVGPGCEQKGLAAGASLYLTKPFGVNTLLHEVLVLLGQ